MALVVCPRPAGAGAEQPRVALADTVPGRPAPAADSLAGPAAAELTSPGADRLAVPAVVETTGVLTVPRAPRTPRTLPTPARFDGPRWVMLRSLLVPGWGQAHNRAWVKLALVAVADGALRVRFIRDERRLNDLSRQANGRLADLSAGVADTVTAWVELEAARALVDQQRIAAAEAARLASQAQWRAANDAYNNVVPVYNAVLETSISRRWILGGVVLYALIDAYVDAHFRRFDVDFQFDPALPGGSTTPGARLQLRWSF